MKRSEMIRLLLKKLKEWENCKIRFKETRELLEFIESKGMLPPDKNAHLKPPCDMIFEWESEK